MSNDCCAFGYRRANPTGMVKVMVRVDHVFDRLVRSEFLRLGEHSRRAQFMLWGFDQYQMIRKLNQDAVVALSREVPESIADSFNIYHGRRGRWRFLRRLNVSRCGKVTGVAVDRIFGNLDISDGVLVIFRCEPRGKFQTGRVGIIVE